MKVNKYPLLIIISLVIWIGIQNSLIINSNKLFQIQDTYLGGGRQAYDSNKLVYARGNFDGIHYTGISSNGYGFAQQAFFPLYPLLINLMTRFQINEYQAGVVLSNLFLCAFILMLYKLLSVMYSTQNAFWIIVILLTFPTSFFFTSIYTESIFLFFVVCSIYYWYTKKYLLSGVFGLLASCTRLSGIFLLPAFSISWFFENNKSKKAFITFTLIPIGLLTYMSYLYITTRDPLLFLHTQILFGQNRSEKFILLPQVIWRYIKILTSISRYSLQYLTTILEFVIGIMFFITSLISFKKGSKEISIFSFLSYLVPTLTGTFASLPRYVLTCLSTFIMIGIIISSKKNTVKLIYVLASLCILVIFSTMFYTGNWVS